jgi:hypothetical protein
VHPRGFQHLSRARGPQSTRARGGDGKGVTCQALVQSWFLFRVSNSQLSFSCVSEAEALFFLNKITKRWDLIGRMSFLSLGKNERSTKKKRMCFKEELSFVLALLLLHLPRKLSLFASLSCVPRCCYC